MVFFNINICGVVLFLGNNQLFFVVNGIFIINDLYSFDDGLNGLIIIDFGNVVQIVNLDDIVFINVLKGLVVFVFYGLCVVNGVIFIEIKMGKDVQGWGVEINFIIMVQIILKLFNY